MKRGGCLIPLVAAVILTAIPAYEAGTFLLWLVFLVLVAWHARPRAKALSLTKRATGQYSGRAGQTSPKGGPAMPKHWTEELEAKHGMPLHQIPGKVYALHYEVPQVLRSVSSDYAGPSPRSDADGFLSAGPIRHYVGWTQQAKPAKRISRHGPAAYREVVYLQPGTMHDETALKLTGACPKCGEQYADSLAVRPGSHPERQG